MLGLDPTQQAQEDHCQLEGIHVQEERVDPLSGGNSRFRRFSTESRLIICFCFPPTHENSSSIGWTELSLCQLIKSDLSPAQTAPPTTSSHFLSWLLIRIGGGLSCAQLSGLRYFLCLRVCVRVCVCVTACDFWPSRQLLDRKGLCPCMSNFNLPAVRGGRFSYGRVSQSTITHDRSLVVNYQLVRGWSPFVSAGRQSLSLLLSPPHPPLCLCACLPLQSSSTVHRRLKNVLFLFGRRLSFVRPPVQLCTSKLGGASEIRTCSALAGPRSRRTPR